LSHADASFDILIASRLFTVLPKRRRAVAEMYRVLRPGGRCFIAEPRWAFWASIPLFTMWLLAGLTHFKNGYREPSRARVLSTREMNRLFCHATVAENRNLAGRALSIRPVRKRLTLCAPRRDHVGMNAIHRILDPLKGDRVPTGLCALAVMTKAPQLDA